MRDKESFGSVRRNLTVLCRFLSKRFFIGVRDGRVWPFIKRDIVELLPPPPPPHTHETKKTPMSTNILTFSLLARFLTASSPSSSSSSPPPPPPSSSSSSSSSSCEADQCLFFSSTAFIYFHLFKHT